MEKGEIVHAETLEGFYPVKVVTIKDDGKAIFRPDGFAYERLDKKEDLRTELELLAYSIDQVLEFGLVPPVVPRDLKEKRGTLQKFVEDAEIAENYGDNWPEVVAESEILKAAVFDFLINAKDRHEGNFLVDPESEKIWLIDHDDLMFRVNGFSSHILVEAIRRNLAELTEEILASLIKLLVKIDQLLATQLNPEIHEVLVGVRDRAQNLLETKRLALNKL